LLLEGINDLAPGNHETSADVVAALRQDVEMAKSCGVQQVFLSTLTPEVFGCPTAPPGAANCRDWAIDPTDVLTPTNEAIRQLATEKGIVLVDSYRRLAANLAADIDFDGLHLTRAGREDLAQVFFEAIQGAFETQPMSRKSKWPAHSAVSPPTAVRARGR
jgi:lysophospholipase L1-like esterase